MMIIHTPITTSSNFRIHISSSSGIESSIGEKKLIVRNNVLYKLRPFDLVFRYFKQIKVQKRKIAGTNIIMKTIFDLIII